MNERRETEIAKTLPDLDERIINVLWNEKITTMKQLLGMTDVELHRMPNFGTHSFRCLKESLKTYSTKVKPKSVRRVKYSQDIIDSISSLFESDVVITQEMAKITKWLARVEGQLNNCQKRLDGVDKDLRDFAALKNAESSRRQMAERELGPYKEVLAGVKNLLSESYNMITKIQG